MNGLNSPSAIFFGSPPWCSFNSGPTTITERPEESTRLPSRFWRKRPCLPLSMSASDFSGRLLAPVMTRPRRPVSNNASTASCSMRFSVRAEAALLAREQVGERLQRALVGAGEDAAAAAVVEQRVDRLLQHALFVADDDVGRAQFHQPLQA